MDSDHFLRLKEIFKATIEREPAEREAFLGHTDRA